MKCIKMRCAECLPWLGSSRFKPWHETTSQPDHIKIRLCRMRYVLSFMCHMQVGPDKFGSDSTSPQLFWKQWNRIRHKSVLMVGSVLWKGTFWELVFQWQEGKVLSVHCEQPCCQNSWATTQKHAPAPLHLNTGKLNKTNVTQIGEEYVLKGCLYKQFTHFQIISTCLWQVVESYVSYTWWGENSFAPKWFPRF